MAEYKLRGTITMEIETVLDEPDNYVPDVSTLEFLVEQDLLDLGYDVDNFKVSNFEIIRLTA